LQVRQDRVDPLGLYDTTHVRARRPCRKAPCARRASPCTPRTRRSGRRRCAASRACASITTTSTSTARSPATAAGAARASSRPSCR
jgi:hypothetical protein